MFTRRLFFRHLLAISALLGTVSLGHAQSDQVAQATGFMRQTGDQMVQIINAGSSDEQKKSELQQVVDRVVDVNDIGRFCLGRYWRVANPAQQQEFLRLFHAVLMNNITSKIGEYRGVSFSLSRSTTRDGRVAVGTVIVRPNNAPANVQWIISFDSGSPKIVDVLAEGTSLRLTQRSDYASYLAHNNNDVNALITAMRHQIEG
jgi:phospholipid transport system substrate-binding protein